MIIKLKPGDTITIISEGKFPQKLKVMIAEDGLIRTKGGSRLK